MSLTRILAVVLRQYYIISGSLPRLLPLVIWVAVDMFLWGFLSKYLNSLSPAGMDFIPHLLGAILFWDFNVRVMHGITMAFFEEVWSRNFLGFFASPLTLLEYLSGLVMTSILTSVIGLIAMLVLSVSFFGLSFVQFGFLLFPFLSILFFFGIALGIFANAMVIRLGPASEWLIWPIPALLSPFVGVLYPVSTLPRLLQWISYLLPPTYVFESLRAFLAHQPIPKGSLEIGGALVIGYVFLSCFFFYRTYHYATQTGLLARYSAEAVN